ncbi:hypothetical protein [Secundilactobacillus paracollinoides]|uniref:hypothetical protein n=1 Tax=Secundilactobacillus paracollinoides TaxID=240427 RepID=UPI0006D1AF8B|nr:hypothetical protein [Secundilactobacillus paracollinoides]
MKTASITALREALAEKGTHHQKWAGRVMIATSITDGSVRAKVRFHSGKSFKNAWQNVVDLLHNVDNHSDVKVDLVTNIQKLTRQQFTQQLAAVPRMHYWRKGISFDAQFQTALLEEELNANALTVPSPDHVIGENGAAMTLDVKKTASFLLKQHNVNVPDLADATNVWVFTTKAAFYDGERVMPITDSGLGIGTRTLGNFQQELKTVIDNGEQFLKAQIQDSGRFIYGYYPAREQVLTNYNTVRHFSSLYALAETSAFVHDDAAFDRIKLSLKYGLDNLTIQRDGCQFAVDYYKNKDDELKLGSQATVLLALCKYQEVTGDHTFEPVLQRVINGLKYFRTADNGFIHVLHTDLSEKDKFRIIYYEGEITFALSRCYELTGNVQAKTIVQETLDHMAAHNYGRFHDHWISYAVNEALELFGDNRDYMKLAIANAFGHLDFIAQRDTAYPTLLELLDAASKMVDKVNAAGQSDLLAEVDVSRLRDVQTFRAKHEVATGCFLPEVAMYFYQPNKFVGGFFARHDHFRTRIDDCEHFLSGLVNYYQLLYA